MDSKTFLKILENPTQIELYAQEMGHLTNEHPYCQIMHFLNAKLAYSNNSLEAEKKVQIAATYATDRNQLRKLLKKTDTSKHTTGYNQPNATWTVTSVYEEIAKLSQQNLSANPPYSTDTTIQYEKTAFDGFSQISSQSLKKDDENNASFFQNILTEEETKKEVAQNSTDILPDELRKNLQQMQLNRKRFLESLKEETDNKITKTERISQERPQPVAKSKDVQKTQVELIERFIQQKPSISTPENIDIPEIDLADISQQKIGFVSENLAVIFEKQGKFERAIEYYKQLQLKNPEKSAYFAAKILALTEKLKS